MSKDTDKLRLKFLWSIKNELIITAIFFFIFGAVVPLIRKVDPTAGALDLGLLHFLVLAPATVFVGLVCFWLVVNFGLTWLDKWFDGKEPGQTSIESDFRQAGPTARLMFFAIIFAVVMLAYVVALLAFT